MSTRREFLKTAALAAGSLATGASASEVSFYQCTVFENWTVDGETNAWRDLAEVITPYQT